jgi:hypothetical protein
MVVSGVVRSGSELVPRQERHQVDDYAWRTAIAFRIRVDPLPCFLHPQHQPLLARPSAEGLDLGFAF